MKYSAAVSIILVMVLVLSCGSDSSDTRQESVTEVQSLSEIFLAENGFESVNEANELGELSLQLAVLNDDIEMVRLLIADGAEIDARGRYGATPLSCASIRGHYDIAELLVDEGADVNFRAETDDLGETPLHQAAVKGYTDIVELLLDNGAEIDAPGIGGTTPLHMATVPGHLEVMEILLNRGAQVDAVFGEDPQFTPFQLALNTENYLAVALLVEAGADDKELFLLENGRAGLFMVGMNGEVVGEVAQAYGDVELEEVDLMLEGMSAPAIEITFPQDTSEALVLELDIEDATVYRINITSDRFMTNSGIGTASTFSDLQDNYQFEDFFWTDYGYPFIIIEELDASVILEPGEWWVLGEVEGTVPPETKVESILIL